MEKELKRKLIFAESFEDIKFIILKMIDNGISVESYLTTTIYRRLALDKKQVEKYNKLLSIVGDIKNIPKEKITQKPVFTVSKDNLIAINRRELSRDSNRVFKLNKNPSYINYKYNNASSPYQGGSVTPK